MKDLNLLVWLTQLGLSVAAPLACATLLALWLYNSQGWGQWVLWVGIGFGILCAVEGFRSSLKLLRHISKKKDDPEPPPVCFNDHD